jgi:hypothetical protein
VSTDSVKREQKAKQDINWDILIEDGEQQIEDAHARIEKLTDCIEFFKKQRDADAQKAATHN